MRYPYVVEQQKTEIERVRVGERRTDREVPTFKQLRAFLILPNIFFSLN